MSNERMKWINNWTFANHYAFNFTKISIKFNACSIRIIRYFRVIHASTVYYTFMSKINISNTTIVWINYQIDFIILKMLKLGWQVVRNTILFSIGMLNGTKTFSDNKPNWLKCAISLLGNKSSVVSDSPKAFC